MNTDLRNALIAKTVLRDTKVTPIGLMLTSVEEAKRELINSDNFGHRNIKVIQQRSRKIYKNLLKQFSTKKLVFKFSNIGVNSTYLYKNKKAMTPKSPKGKVIEAIMAGSYKQIDRLVIQKVAE